MYDPTCEGFQAAFDVGDAELDAIRPSSSSNLSLNFLPNCKLDYTL